MCNLLSRQEENDKDFKMFAADNALHVINDSADDMLDDDSVVCVSQVTRDELVSKMKLRELIVGSSGEYNARYFARGVSICDIIIRGNIAHGIEDITFEG